MDYNFRINQKKGLKSLATRIVVDKINMREEIEGAYKKILAYMGRKDIYPKGAPYIIYNFEDTHIVDLTVGFPIGKTIITSGDLFLDDGVTGKVFACTHTGSYKEVQDGFRKLRVEGEKKGLNYFEKKYEIHQNELNSNQEFDLITEIGYFFDK